MELAQPSLPPEPVATSLCCKGGGCNVSVMDACATLDAHPAVMRLMSITGCNNLRPPGQEWGQARSARDESTAPASGWWVTSPARSWEMGFPKKAVLQESHFTLCSALSSFKDVSHPYGILGAVPKDKAGDTLTSSLAPLLLCGSVRAAHSVLCVMQLTTAQRKNNDLH